MQGKDVYRIQIRKQAGRGRNGQFAIRHAEPKVIAVQRGSTEQLAKALVDAMPEIAPGATARVDKVQVEFVGTLA